MNKKLRQRLLEATPGSAVAQLDRPLKDSSENVAFTAVNSDKREVEVVIILEGPGNEYDRHWYSAQAIADGVKKFAGARAYLNHQTAEEAEARPEQDVREQAGFYKDTYLIPQIFNPKLGRMVTGLGATFIPSATEAGDVAFGLAESQVLWRQVYPDRPGDCFAGISINSGGQADEQPIGYNGEDWINVTSFEDVRSADIVTRPGAGGAFVRLSESLSGVPGKTEEANTMKKNLREAVKLLESATAKWKAEKDAKKKATLEAERDKAQQAFMKLVEAEEKKEKAVKEGEEEAEGEDEEDEDTVDHAAALSAHVPQQDGENPQQYSDRLAAITAHAKAAGATAEPGEEDEDEDEGGMPPMPPKGGAKPGAPKPPMQQSARRHESADVKKFRESQPKLFAEVMTTLRENLGADRLDFKGLKKLVESQASELRSLRLSSDLAACQAMLKEAGIPSKYLTAGDLIKLDESARKRELAKITMIMESAGVSRVFGGGNLGGGEDTGNFEGLDKLGEPAE